MYEERMRRVENHYENNRQDQLMAEKLVGGKFVEKQDSYIVSKYLPQDVCLLEMKERKL